MFNHSIRLNRRQKLLTAEQYNRLVDNHLNKDEDHAPVAKFFNPMGQGTWLISELNPETGIAFGLCDLGMGFPELGYVDLHELIEVGRNRILGIERDLHFVGKYPMSHYVDIANVKGTLAGV